MLVDMNPCKHILPVFQQRFKSIAKWKSPGSISFLHSSASDTSLSKNSEQEVVIALGSNVGNRLHNFNEALRMMKTSGIDVTRHGCLYESAPAYVTDQPSFLNSAVRATTKHSPHELLRVLKQIEKALGRTDGIRYGPRPMDLDILFYGNSRINSSDLTIPHERIWERPFVVAPLVDLIGSSEDSNLIAAWHSFPGSDRGLFGQWETLGGEISIGGEGLRRVIPIGKKLWDFSKRTHVMGVLNLTPDSFSDGGKFQSVDDAVSQVRLLISEGADIIDIGAQSTRPNASRISAAEEMNRLVPVLEAILELPELDGKLLSVDTFYSEVASVAASKGVHIINDVSGGRLDPDILGVVSKRDVCYVAMHMRGDPSTMQDRKNLEYGDVCKDVACELLERIKQAELLGVPVWKIMIDPGIGFSKNCDHNLDILMGLPSIRRELGLECIAASHAPILIGPSRKRFLGEVCDRANPIDRDPATVAAVTAGILGGANIVRVHNVRNGLDAAKVSDALLKHRRS